MTLSAPGTIVSMGPGEKKYGGLIFEVDKNTTKVYNESRANILFEIPTHLAESFAEDLLISIDELEDGSEESS